MVALSAADWGGAEARTVSSVQPPPLRPASALSTPLVARISVSAASARPVGLMTLIGWVPDSG